MFIFGVLTMTALHQMKDVLGPGGYRIYANAFGRSPTRFHASISNPNTTTSRLVALACQVMLKARDAGISPTEIVRDAASIECGGEGAASLRVQLETLLGVRDVERLRMAAGASEACFAKALDKPTARHAPHFKAILSALRLLSQQGGDLNSLVNELLAMQHQNQIAA
ncbi:hypothetical protein D2T29_12880 [Sinirhodobacter populi]|uniref:Uncharacterized protein n=1 Tax=Paenirhodobacter populi TaxID=2306993 RepID=A0A443KCR3_9RHOB|nr:hypothetical protein [Sinirhodobacter populi]RWR30560.1 hypothetical protein D2T29_12880 [Sinirhodobacter populi]